MNGQKTVTHRTVKDGLIVEAKITVQAPKKAFHKSLNRPRHGLEKERIWKECAI